MKQLLAFLVLALVPAFVWAQAPQAISYQAVARDGQGAPLANQPVSIRISIKNTSAGAAIYQETQTGVNTNQFGLFTIEIGNGNAVVGVFANIDWSTAKYVTVEFDPAGGSNYLNMGTTQLLSVPYALYAETSGNGGGGGDDWGSQTTATDATLTGNGTSGSPLKVAQQSATNGQVLQWNGTTWAPATVNSGDNWGTQNVQTDGTLAGTGVTGNTLKIAQQGASSGQVLKWNGSSWAPANDIGGSGGSGDDWGTQVAQTDGSTITGTGVLGNTIRLAQQGATNGQILKWNGSSWAPAADNNTGTTYTAGTGISISGGNVITNTAPAVNYTAGTGISISGSTITNTSPGVTYTAGSGINISGNVISSSGSSVSITGTGVSGTSPNFTITPPTYTAGSGINITGSYPNFTVAATGGSGGVTSTGTNNFIAKFSPNGNALVNSLVQDNGSSIGINTAPDANARVTLAAGNINGGLRINYTSTTNGSYGLNVNSTNGNANLGYAGTVTIGSYSVTGPVQYNTTATGANPAFLATTTGANTSVATIGLSSVFHGGFFATTAADTVSGVVGSYNGTKIGFGVSGLHVGTGDGGIGVLGFNARATGSVNIGVQGTYSPDAYGAGLVGVGFGGDIPPAGPNDFGLWASAQGDGGTDGNFAIYGDGNFVIANGTKSASVGTSKGNQLVYCVESPEVWFEDFGHATLVNGEVTIQLDPLFLETVVIDEKHPMIVIVTPQGESKGLYVVPGATSFTVKEQGNGNSNISFSYRITCKRLNYQDHRFGSDPVWGGGDTRVNSTYVQPRPIQYNGTMKQRSGAKGASNLGSLKKQFSTAKGKASLKN